MSHEGIRIVREDQALQEAQESAWIHRDLTREATDPLHVRVNKTAGTGMEIEWKDGHKSSWSFAWLRDACPCATCHEEREASGRKAGARPAESPSLLPMFKEPARPETVQPIGNYAVSFHWKDGHRSGIYSWDYLRRHCNCAECQEASSRMASGN